MIKQEIQNILPYRNDCVILWERKQSCCRVVASLT